MTSPVASGDDTGSAASPSLVEQRRLSALLTTFPGHGTAGSVCARLEGALRSDGDTVVETTVLQVDRQHRASVHDPRRVRMGAIVSGFTWGLFGLLTGGIGSMVASALIGGAWGGLMARRAGHHVSEGQLASLGAQLPADSSAALVFAETSHARMLIDVPAALHPSMVSVAEVDEDLSARVHTRSKDEPSDVMDDGPASDRHGRLSMIVVRYPHISTAAEVAARLRTAEKATAAPQVEMVIETDDAGGRHVTDHKLGAAAVARYNIGSWAVLGLICGAIAGISGDAGILGILQGGLVTGLFWGLFGAVAGVLYGLLAGRTVSARRLKGIAPMLKPGTSLLVAWGEAPLGGDTLATVALTPGTRMLVLGFDRKDGGAILTVA
ncbi:MAG: hypothetical protein U0667_00155 [Chloroflexota bacterium]